MSSLFHALQDQGCLSLEAQLTNPPRLAVGGMLGSGQVYGQLVERFAPSGKLWRHRARALDLIAEGKNLVIATGTASGKSLVFQIPIVVALLGGDTTSLFAVAKAWLL